MILCNEKVLRRKKTEEVQLKTLLFLSLVVPYSNPGCHPSYSVFVAETGPYSVFICSDKTRRSMSQLSLMDSTLWSFQLAEMIQLLSSDGLVKINL